MKPDGRDISQEVEEAMGDPSTITVINCCRNGNTEYAPSGLHVMLYELGGKVVRTTYEFFCLDCRLLVERDVDAKTARALVSVGVTTTSVVIPAEVLEHPRGVAPLTENDLFNFAGRLEESDPKTVIEAAGG